MERTASAADAHAVAPKSVEGQSDVIECRRSLWPGVLPWVAFTALVLYSTFFRTLQSSHLGSSKDGFDLFWTLFIVLGWIWIAAGTVCPPLIVTPTHVGIMKHSPFGRRIWISRSEISRAYCDGLWITIQRNGARESINVFSVPMKYHNAVLKALNCDSRQLHFQTH